MQNPKDSMGKVDARVKWKPNTLFVSFLLFLISGQTSDPTNVTELLPKMLVVAQCSIKDIFVLTALHCFQWTA